MIVHRVMQLTRIEPKSSSVWKGTTADSRVFYAEFQRGFLRVGVGVTEKEAKSDEGVVMRLPIQQPHITFEDLQGYLRGRVKFF